MWKRVNQRRAAMRLKKIILFSCAGNLLLMLASTSYAADSPSGVIAAPPASASVPADPTGTAAPGDQVAVTDTSIQAGATMPAEARTAADPCADQAKTGSLDCER